MFDYLNGVLTDKRKSQKGMFLTLEVNGIGYLLEVSERDFNIATISSDKLKLYTHLVHREDVMAFYGFLNKETRDIFQILLSVSGVGAKMAIALLNEFDTYDLISFVIESNYKELTRAKGVGTKLAQKIILELKDKLIKTDLPKNKTSNLPETQAISDVQAIMLSLGYSEQEIEQALANVSSIADENANAEDILRQALTSLSM